MCKEEKLSPLPVVSEKSQRQDVTIAGAVVAQGY